MPKLTLSVFSARSPPYSACIAKSQLDLNNIEAVFAAFDMATMIGSLPDHTPEDIKHLLPSMRVVIARTIEETMRFQRSLDHRDPPQPYTHFAELLLFLRDGAYPAEDSYVITFNYDLAIDLALARHGAKVKYGLHENEPDAYRVLKLAWLAELVLLPLMRPDLAARHNTFYVEPFAAGNEFAGCDSIKNVIGAVAVGTHSHDESRRR